MHEHVYLGTNDHDHHFLKSLVGSETSDNPTLQGHQK